MNYTTSALASDASYRISYTVDGVQQEFSNVTSGAGLTSASYFWERSGWYNESNGTHDVSVTVDADNTVSETNEYQSNRLSSDG